MHKTKRQIREAEERRSKLHVKPGISNDRIFLLALMFIFLGFIFLFLVDKAHADTSVDTTGTAATTNRVLCTSSFQKLSVSFVAGQDGFIAGATSSLMYTNNGSNPDADMTVAIYDDSTGPGTEINSGTVSYTSLNTSTLTDVYTTFSAPVAVTNGTTYWVVWDCAPATVGGNFVYRVGAIVPGPDYPHTVYDGASWTGDNRLFRAQFTITDTSGPVSGCTDPAAENYNPEASIDDDSCTYAPFVPPPPVPYVPQKQEWLLMYAVFLFIFSVSFWFRVLRL